MGFGWGNFVIFGDAVVGGVVGIWPSLFCHFSIFLIGFGKQISIHAKHLIPSHVHALHCSISS